MNEIWGKKKDERIYHPLLFHLIDVAAVTQVFWERGFQVNFQNTIREGLGIDLDSTKQWLSFFCGLHDIGKASPDFQRKSSEAKRLLELKGFGFPRVNYNTKHGIITAKILERLFSNNNFHNGCFNSKLAKHIGLAIGGHHGVFPTGREVLNIPLDGAGTNQWQDIQQQLFFKLSSLLNIGALQLPKNISPSPNFFIILAGLTSVADWIASNEDFFPYLITDGISSDDYFVFPTHVGVNR